MHTSLQGQGWLESWLLDFINCIGLGEKDPWHCSGQLVGGVRGSWGGGVFIYNLGFICTAYCVLLWHVLVLLCFWVFLHNMQRHWSGHVIFTCQECRQVFQYQSLRKSKLKSWIFFIGDIFGFSSALKLFSTVPLCYVRRCFIQQDWLNIEKLYVPADLTSHIQPGGLCPGSRYFGARD